MKEKGTPCEARKDEGKNGALRGTRVGMNQSRTFESIEDNSLFSVLEIASNPSNEVD